VNQVLGLTLILLLNSHAKAGIPSPEAFLNGTCGNMGGCYCQDGHGVPWNATCDWGRVYSEPRRSSIVSEGKLEKAIERDAIRCQHAGGYWVIQYAGTNEQCVCFGQGYTCN
jgi:hypothetical protein